MESSSIIGNETAAVHTAPEEEGPKNAAFKCCHCGKEFPRISNWRRHERLHTEGRRYQCHYCPKKFSCAYSQRRHEDALHKDGPHHCSCCSKKFGSIKKRRRHEKLHTFAKRGERKPLVCGKGPKNAAFKCRYCGKSFPGTRNLKRHERLHSRDLPIRCPKKFGSVEERRRHEKLQTSQRVSFHQRLLDESWSALPTTQRGVLSEKNVGPASGDQHENEVPLAMKPANQIASQVIDLDEESTECDDPVEEESTAKVEQSPGSLLCDDCSLFNKDKAAEAIVRCSGCQLRVVYAAKTMHSWRRSLSIKNKN